MELLLCPMDNSDVFNVLLTILQYDDISFVMLAVSSKTHHKIMAKYGGENNVKRFLICAKIASLGYLNILKYARDNDYPWDRFTCAYAAKNGDLEMLRW